MTRTQTGQQDFHLQESNTAGHTKANPGRDRQGRFLPGAAWHELHPNGSPVTGRRLVKRKLHWKECRGCGEVFDGFAWQHYHSGRCRARYGDKMLKAKGLYRDTDKRKLVAKERILTDEQKARLLIREGPERVRDPGIYDPAKGGWADPRQPRPHELPPALSSPLTTPLEDILARIVRPGAAYYAAQILGKEDGILEYAGEEIYSGSPWTKILLILVVRGSRWLDRQIRKAERREMIARARDHNKARVIAQANGQGSQLEASLPGQSAYRQWKRQNRAVSQTPSENAPLDQAR